VAPDEDQRGQARAERRGTGVAAGAPCSAMVVAVSSRQSSESPRRKVPVANVAIQTTNGKLKALTSG
tara:strand:+ start:3607 stop:3807 length:201 start_codon:yes stop_codon:yes gene_type:complete